MSLYTFCESGDIDGVRAALGRGEDVNRIWQHGDCGNFRCADNPNCDFKALPLQGAIKGNHLDIIALLLQQPSIDVNLRTFVGYTALNMACMLGRTMIVRQLLSFPGVDPDLSNDLGRTPLMEASFRGHSRCVAELVLWTKKKEQESMMRIKMENKKKSERRKEEELLQKRETEAANGSIEAQKRREEEKKKIGQGKGRNARKRKKEQKRRKEQEESGLEEEKTRLEENEKKLKDQSKVSEEQDKDETWLEGHYELKQTENEEDKVMSIKEPKNRSLVEFMERQILELEEELECPVCLEVAATAPIYKCPDDHLVCRYTGASV